MHASDSVLCALCSVDNLYCFVQSASNPYWLLGFSCDDHFMLYDLNVSNLTCTNLCFSTFYEVPDQSFKKGVYLIGFEKICCLVAKYAITLSTSQCMMLI